MVMGRFWAWRGEPEGNRTKKASKEMQKERAGRIGLTSLPGNGTREPGRE
jgi:hypothetical protein